MGTEIWCEKATGLGRARTSAMTAPSTRARTGPWLGGCLLHTSQSYVGTLMAQGHGSCVTRLSLDLLNVFGEEKKGSIGR